MDTLKTIEEYILNFGFNLSEFSLENIDITKADLRNAILPEDINLFQKIKDKSLYKVKLPTKDYSKYNFDGVNLAGTIFTEDSILPKNDDFFQKIKDKELFETILPCINMNNYNFENVKIAKTTFTKNSTLSSNSDFFQHIFNKSLYMTTLPIGNYTIYNMSDVSIIGCDFNEESTLSYDSNFFQNIRDKSSLYAILPNHIVDNLHLYNLNGVEIDLTKYKINVLKMMPLYEKFKDSDKITFPLREMSYRKSKEIQIKK